jgi:hypothetical protein
LSKRERGREGERRGRASERGMVREIVGEEGREKGWYKRETW